MVTGCGVKLALARIALGSGGVRASLLKTVIFGITPRDHAS